MTMSSIQPQRPLTPTGTASMSISSDPPIRAGRPIHSADYHTHELLCRREVLAEDVGPIPVVSARIFPGFGPDEAANLERQLFSRGILDDHGWKDFQQQPIHLAASAHTSLMTQSSPSFPSTSSYYVSRYCIRKAGPKVIEVNNTPISSKVCWECH